MTAVTFTNTQTPQIQAAQRGATVLRIDAVVSEIAGLILLLGGGSIAESLGLLPVSLSTAFGIVMFLYGAGLWLATSRWMGVRLLRGQAIANVVWFVGMELLLMSGAVPFTGLGIAVVIITNLTVLAMGVLQWRAANRMS